MKLARIPYFLHAKLCGYFWLPCPLCGEYGSGYEWMRTFARGKYPVLGGHGICEACCDKGLGDPPRPFLGARLSFGGPSRGALLDTLLRILFERPLECNFRDDKLRRMSFTMFVFTWAVAAYNILSLPADAAARPVWTWTFRVPATLLLILIGRQNFRGWRAHVRAKDKPPMPSRREMERHVAETEAMLREYKRRDANVTSPPE